ncbi:RAD9, HUS1, RAD1-interacting nuclear orphan protein 1-like [Phascolarctos cinereus]|uniref:RAD9, HUS1, RAD1-interacting nuclear orphan protein 1-like n=1 Tax=Phascolarctos cinereus TaxID=38626 RepID=A0A6P5L7Q9_PHACI|nr:RAD9, HUS1, RAD1-interacting nuclear orphan protein 1-like [Phascolarctos cinereus]
MPRKKKSNGPRRKAQLSFRERPLEGPKHGGGSPRPCPAPSRLAPLRPADREPRPAWVSPQFKKPLGSWLPVRRKRPPPPPHRRLPFRFGGPARRRRSLRRARSCWFPPLTFKSLRPGLGTGPGPKPSSRAAAAQQENPDLEGPEEARRPPTLSARPRSCAPRRPKPSDLETRGLPSTLGDAAATPREQGRGRCPLHLARPQTPPPGSPPLVVDTPEEKYGLKVTWRRRYYLVTYLRKRGKLSLSQIFVSKSEALNPWIGPPLPCPQLGSAAEQRCKALCQP